MRRIALNIDLAQKLLMIKMMLEILLAKKLFMVLQNICVMLCQAQHILVSLARLLRKDVNTPAVFGGYIDIYDIAQAVEDGATVRIYYESRLAKISLTDEGKKLVEDLDNQLGSEELSETQKAKAKWTQLEALIGSENRVKNISKDIVSHFESRQSVFEGKGMIVAMSRRIAASLYQAIITLRPNWHNDDLKKGVIKVVMTAASSDGPQMANITPLKSKEECLQSE